MTDAFFRRDGERYLPQVHTRGPWDPDFQHGGPPSALLATAAMGHPAVPEGARLARITVDFLRAVPLAPLTVTVEVEKVGRTAQRLVATLHGDRPVLRAQTLFLRGTPGPQAEPAPDVWPPAAACAPFVFPFFRWAEGYHQAVELRPLPGEAWGGPTLRLWARPRVALIAGEADRPEARAIVLADAESGMAPPMDPNRWSYANPDLTVVFARRPVGDWLGFEARSFAGDAGAGLSEASLRDAQGPFARSVQSLVVTPRAPAEGA